MYIEIPPPVMKDFFVSRGYQLTTHEEWREAIFAKFYQAHNLVIVIGTTVDLRGRQRGYGKDAFRCLLKTIDDDKVRWQLTPTKRMEHWQEHIGRKMHIFEDLMATIDYCSSCGGTMVPKQGPYEVFWACSRSSLREPHLIRKIPITLQQRLLLSTKPLLHRRKKGGHR